ncbi:uncharacterized protein [Henckelia pumila]|uniref:uncharacterized protein n=1 Tax=Henckelia pumila TaxID=405737 RepID=UPI003C6DC888
MSGGEFYSRPKLDSRIDQVKDLIEGCIKRYINKSECKHDLELKNGIDPNLTEIIWNEIEKQNEEFFRTYYVRLIVMEQIRKFNQLLERQLEWMPRITASGVLPAHMNTHDPSLDLNIGQQESKLAEDMQKFHNFGSSILPSLHGFIDAPLCDRQNIEMYSSLVDAPKNIEPSRTVNLQQFGSSTSLQPLTPRLMGGYVPYLAPQNIELYDDAGPSSNTGHLQENVCMSRYDPKFGSCQYSGGSGIRDATMTRTEMRVMSREAGNLGLNPNPYGCFVELAALMGDASIGTSSSAATNPTNLIE